MTELNCLEKDFLHTKKKHTKKQQQKNKQTKNKCPPTPSPHPPIPPELSFLYTTRHLSLFYICTKHHQNIPKGIRVIEQRQEIKFKHKKGT